MKENELKALMRAQLIAGLVSAGYPSVKVKQSYQSTTQGRDQLPTLYYWQLSGPTGFGRPWHVEQYNIFTGNVDVTEVQNILTTFQIMATAPVSPTDTSAPTPGDLALTAMQVIRSSVFIASLQAQGAGLCDNTAIRPMQIQNDQDQFEDVPSFDFTVAHQSRIILTGPALEGAELNILRV